MAFNTVQPMNMEASLNDDIQPEEPYQHDPGHVQNHGLVDDGDKEELVADLNEINGEDAQNGPGSELHIFDTTGSHMKEETKDLE